MTYKIIGLVGRFYEQKLFYKIELSHPYPFHVGEEIWFPEDWKKEQGGDQVWVIESIQHYIVDAFIAVYVKPKD